MERVDVYFSLGSNMGDREAHIEDAMEMMSDAFGCRPKAVSTFVETPSWGFDGHPFINNCVLYRLPRRGTPEEHATSILHRIKSIEATLGRIHEAPVDEQGNRVYHDRPIDIDILYYGNYTINTQELIIPHPLIDVRDFVLIPLREIVRRDILDRHPEIID